MSIHATCQFCKFSFNVDDQHAGQNIKCPHCSALVKITSGLEFIDEATTNCPLCGMQVPKDGDTCKNCGNKIRTTGGVSPVQPLPLPVKHPVVSVGTGAGSRTLIFFLLLLGIGGGAWYYTRGAYSAKPLSQLCPEETKLALVTNWRLLYTLTQESQPQARKIFEALRQKISQNWFPHFPPRLEVQIDEDIDFLCLLDNDGQMWENFWERNGKDVAGALLIRGNFKTNLFTEYASEKRAPKYYRYPILESRIKGLPEKYFFTLLDAKTIAVSPERSTVEKIIDLHRGYKRNEIRGLETPFFTANAVWKLYGQFPRDILRDGKDKQTAVSASGLPPLARLMGFVDSSAAKLTAKLECNLVLEKENGLTKEMAEELVKSFKQRLLHASQPNKAQYVEELLRRFPCNVSGNQIAAEINLEGAERDKGVELLQWLILEGGYGQLVAGQRWQEITRMPSNAEQVKLVEQFLKNPDYQKTPFFAQAKTLKDNYQKEAKEKEAKDAYAKLMASGASNNILGYWEALNNFPANYQDTAAGQEVQQKLVELESQTQAKLEESIQVLKAIIDAKKFSDLESWPDSNMFLLPAHQPIVQKMLAKRTELRTPREVLQKLWESAKSGQKEAMESAGKQKERDYEELLQTSRKFMNEQLQSLIAKREFTKVDNQLKKFQEKFRSFGKPAPSEEEAIQKNLQDLQEIRTLFTMAAETLKDYQSKPDKKLRVWLATKRSSLQGKVQKVEESFFVMQDEKLKKPQRIRMEEVTAKTLAEKLIPAKEKKEQKVLYYLGLLLFYEGDKDSAKTWLQASEKQGYEPAKELLEKIQNQ